MVTIECPWCAEEDDLSLAVLRGPEAGFTCPDCGTSVTFVAEAEALEAAA